MTEAKREPRATDQRTVELAVSTGVGGGAATTREHIGPGPLINSFVKYSYCVVTCFF
jgi:hypothetical protein